MRDKPDRRPASSLVQLWHSLVVVLAASGSGQDKPFHRVGEALVLIRGSNTTGGSLDLMARVTHGDAESRAGEHEHVVGLVADRCDLFRRDLVSLREVSDHGALVGLGVSDVGVV